MPDKPEPNAIDIHVGERLRRLRSVKNMTQQALGDLLGISFQQVQKYEKGANRISASKMFEIMQAFETSADYFFDGLQDTQATPGFAEPPVSGYVLDMERGKQDGPSAHAPSSPAESSHAPAITTPPVTHAGIKTGTTTLAMPETSDGIELLRAYNAIGNAAMKRKLLELAKIMAEDNQPAGQPMSVGRSTMR